MRAYGLEAAVVVGEHEAVGADHHARAVAGEVDHSLHDGIVGLIEFVVGQLVAIALHLLVHCAGQVVERPHAFVSLGMENCQAGEREN